MAVTESIQPSHVSSIPQKQSKAKQNLLPNTGANYSELGIDSIAHVRWSDSLNGAFVDMVIKIGCLFHCCAWTFAQRQLVHTP
jgi:hypothetical protein